MAGVRSWALSNWGHASWFPVQAFARWDIWENVWVVDGHWVKFRPNVCNVGTKIRRVKVSQTMQAQIGQQKRVEVRGTGWRTDKWINSHRWWLQWPWRSLCSVSPSADSKLGHDSLNTCARARAKMLLVISRWEALLANLYQLNGVARSLLPCLILFPASRFFIWD